MYSVDADTIAEIELHQGLHYERKHHDNTHRSLLGF